MTYRKQLQLAVERTDNWKLGCLSSRLMGMWANHGEEHGFKLNNQPGYWARFSRAIPLPPELRANSCAPAHFGALLEIMASGNEWAPVITIGDVLHEGRACFGVTRNALRRSLREGPEASGTISIHVWLTFADLTIYDLTIIPWLLRQEGQSMDLSRPDGLAVLDDPDELEPHLDYRPKLIGPEFLWKTGTLAPGAEQLYATAEAAWSERTR